MPFIGRDWRSPGEAWVKTESLGWQRMKIIESQLHPNCHQYHNLACSWPPPSQFGQHMANNCGSENFNDKKTSLDADTNKLTCVIDKELKESSSHGRGTSSACSSNNSSASSSPVSSPEKNNAHHLHPITISSPYGLYLCCGHHNNLQHNSDSSCVAPQVTKHSCCDHSNQNHIHHHQQQHQMLRSLSRDSFEPSDISPISCSNNSQKMRYNNSFSDLRISINNSSLPIKHDEIHGQSTTNKLANEQIDATELASSSSSNSERSTTKDQNNQVKFQQTSLILNNGIKLFDSDSNRQKEISLQVSGEPCKSVGIDSASQDQRSRSLSPQSCQYCCCCHCSCCNHQQLPTTSTQTPGSQQNFKEQLMQTAPHCRVSVRTREVAMYNTISEAFYRLDFYNAIHDIRRFNYICKLLHLLVTQNLTSLSGCATKVLFSMLEQVAWEVSSNKRNIHVIKNLLNELRESIQKYYCWGRPIGSSVLWQQHFDTIERISRIVDGIELSQTNLHDDNQTTFDKLPNEMIREILLRLNDYRDLVNSAQASPVMRNMIDEQYIWQKLCRYHFTEQQLKLVFENSSYLNRVKGSTLRGIKYARTVSADGKVSYRNPIAHKRISGRSSAKSDPRRDTDYRQQQQQQRNYGSHSSSSSGGSSSSSDSDGSPTESTSHVIKTIRIFDKEGTSATLIGSNSGMRSSRCDERRASSSPAFTSHKNSNINGQPSTSDSGGNRQTLKAKETSQQKTDRDLRDCPPTESNCSNNDVDWELVFHHLRKRFDLKEEYADCLLLCRHCRCLFWKSIGHPCIKNDSDERLERARQTGHRGAFPLSGRSMGDMSNQQRPNSSPGRPSVASLSRSFDNRARVEDGENLRPPPPTRRGIGQQGIEARHPFANRDLQNADQFAIRRMQQNAGQQQARILKRDELVPKHITITPQAFLKFFSL